MLHESVNHIIKSILVIAFLFILIVLSVKAFFLCIQKAKQGEKWYSQVFLSIFLCLVTLLIVFALHNFVNPAERELKPELVATVIVSKEAHPNGVRGESWHAVYGKCGMYPGTWNHPYQSYQIQATSNWPVFDLENYTYIITYGQKIISLSYNIWDASSGPIYTGAKYGHMVLAEEVAPWEIYIYRIPKMRINNPEI